MTLPNSDGSDKPRPAGNPTLDAALAYVRAGLSVVPIKRDGSKAPALSSWKQFQSRPPNDAEVRGWFDRADPPGVAVLGGAASGGLECIDFDVQAESIYPQWQELVDASAPGLADRLSVVRTPRPGFHVRYRCAEAPIPGNTKLAVDPALPKDERCLIETRGEGGYAIVPGGPPECHSSGRPYEHFAGPQLADVRTITSAERQTLLRCARSFDRAPAAASAPPGADLRPGDDFNQRGPDWSEILTGWTVARDFDGRRYWRRPGKQAGWSATTGVCRSKDGAELFACFSENADPFQGASGGRACSCYSKFAAYALLRHGGDFKAAAKELAKLGYGERTHRGDAKPGAANDDLDRLDAVLAAGGAAALFADGPLLEALARIAVEDPAAFAARRAALKGKVSLHDLDAVLRPLRREQAHRRPAVLLAEAGYRVENGRLCREHATREGGAALTPLCNFTARITGTIVRDDGAEQTARFTVAGERADGRELPPVQVAEADFAGMGWVTTAWHGEAVVYAGQGVRDHLRAAVELLSADRTRRSEYAHTGWRRIGDAWLYLHGGGAIGPDGAVADIAVSLPDPLAGFLLPDPPAGEGRAAAIRASLALLHDLAPDPIIFPLVGAVYRAALGDAPSPIDLALHLAGPHGAGKSELAALCQQHYGQAMDRLHLPGGWSSTANATEGLAFAAKDALLVVDDYAPRGAAGDRQRLERDADRLFRAQGNRAGRQRMNRDGSLRPARPPRGLLLSTGEDTPPGQSLRGRMLIVEVSKEDVEPKSRLAPYQNAAAAGLYAQALAGFVRWLAPQYGDLGARLAAERAALRDRAQTGAGSARTPGVVADLALGLKCFLDFAAAAGVLGAAERGELVRRGWQALQRAAAAQAEHVGAAEPAALFLRRLIAALASGRAHVAGPDGGEPANPGAWGWTAQEYQARNDETYTHWRTPAGSRRVGWVDGPALYLEPEASYAAAQELARDQGEALPVTAQTLRKRLHERGLLISTGDGGRETLTVRRTLAGQRRAVLHLRADALSAEKPDQPDQPGPDAGANGRFRGQSAGQVAPGAAADLTTEPDQNAPENGHWSGWSGFPQEGEGGPASNGTAAPPSRPAGGLKPLRATRSPRPAPGPADDAELDRRNPFKGTAEDAGD